MKLSETYHTLFDEITAAAPFHQLADYPVDVVTLPYISNSYGILPKKSAGRSRELADIFPEDDSSIRENREFNYKLFLPRGYRKGNRAIMLMHGLNEKNWKKYLPWALSLTLQTQTPVILFPFAFHMDRAPAHWSQPRVMQNLMQFRSRIISSLSRSTFINAALSQRLDHFPHRFYLSGYQTATDMFRLMQSMKNGLHPYFKEDTRTDLFAYSIGAFLAQIMLIADKDGLLRDSRIMLFCGGAVFQDMAGESKLIMDSSAFNRLLDYFVNNLESDISKKRPYTHLLSKSELGKGFRSMIGRELNWETREETFKTHAKNIRVIGLQKDTVIPCQKIEETLLGKAHDIPIEIDILDFPFEYSHEMPFPMGRSGDVREVDAAFDKVFHKASQFFA